MVRRAEETSLSWSDLQTLTCRSHLQWCSVGGREKKPFVDTDVDVAPSRAQMLERPGPPAQKRALLWKISWLAVNPKSQR